MALPKPAEFLGHDRFIRKSLRIFFLIFFASGALIGGLTTAVYNRRSNDYLEVVRSSQDSGIAQRKAMVEQVVNIIKNDIMFLVNLQSLHRWLRSDSSEDMLSLAKDFSSFSSARQIYDQLRYLDDSGMERVRVNLKHGIATMIPILELQNKKERPYFAATMALDQGRFYISPLDLNIEHGQIETPFKPTLRVGSPVFDDHGKKCGMILLNYLAERLIKQIRAEDAISIGQTIMLNDEGYWLIGLDRQKEWAFMFEDKKVVTFSSEFPEVWGNLTRENHGQFLAEAGLYTFVTIYPERWSDGRRADPVKPLDEEHVHSRSWKLIAFVSQSIIGQRTRELAFQLFLFGAALFLITATISWYLAQFITRRRFKQNQLELQAMHDALTGLPNRRLFEDRLDVAIGNALRYHRRMGLLFIDLDGFKQVNDTLGHDAGDELLQKVAATFLKSCRKSDTIARLGGDEFAVIMTEVEDCEGAVATANKLIDSLSAPFALFSGPARVGASIGVAICPDHGKEADVLVKKADDAMYASKTGGKNICTLAEF